MIKLLSKLTVTYLAFGVGIIVGSIIASTVAALLLVATLDKEQLETLNAVAEDFEKE